MPADRRAAVLRERVLLLGCATPAWHADTPWLAVPEPVDFAQVGIAGAWLPIELGNDGGGDARITATTELPFRVGAGLVTVAAGATATLQVGFTPPDYAPATGTLVLVWDEGSATVALSGSVDPDGDNDGHDALASGGDDCDDTDADVYPGAPSTCHDGVDQACDGGDDDCDGDGFVADDCDDGDAAVHPGAPELDDGVDQDCDGRVDEDFLTHGDLVITEVHADFPPWIELCAARPVNLAGIMLGDVSLDALVVPQGGCITVCRDACDAYVDLVIDAAEDTVLVESDATLDELSWDATWPVDPGRTRSLDGRLVDADQNDLPTAWCFTDGSPGTPNLACPG